MSDWLADNFPVIAERLGDYRCRTADTAKARCPNRDKHKHGDANPSLLLKLAKNGGLILRCMVCGDDKQGVLDALGVTWHDVCCDHGKKRTPSVLVKAYQYRSPDGNDAYQVCRYQPKTFKPRRRLPQCGELWCYNTRGGPVKKIQDSEGWKWVAVPGKEPVDKPGPGEISVPPMMAWPYMADLIEATESENKLILWVEGEKAADNLMALGFIATTTHGGAGARHFDKRFAKLFRGRHVIVLPDNDDPGRDYARYVIGCLADSKVASLATMHLPGLSAKQDSDDWIQRNRRGHEDTGPNSQPAQRLRALIAKQSCYSLTTIEDLFNAQSRNPAKG